MSTTTTAPRIDTLVPGSLVELELPNDRFEQALFVRVEGEGEERTATFVQVLTGTRRIPVTLEWQAHRYGNRWAYGSGSAPLRLNEVIAVPTAEVGA